MNILLLVETIKVEDERVEISVQASFAEFSGSDSFSEQMSENKYSPAEEIKSSEVELCVEKRTWDDVTKQRWKDSILEITGRAGMVFDGIPITTPNARWITAMSSS